MNDTLEPGRSVELMPGVRRVIAPNPGLMTGPGTNTYLLGEREIAVIDPGPAIDRHIDAIVAAAGGPIRWILVTHTHPDHSPGASRLAAKTGAELIGINAPDGRHQDKTFRPDRQPADGESFATDEFELSIVHTPGHASNHLCYLHLASAWLFTGDHIIDGSTVVIDPPDGSMSRYLASLERLRTLSVRAIVPGHGAVIAEADAAIDGLIEHRLRREEKVVDRLRQHPETTLAELVTHVYDEIDPAIHSLAERSLLAHLLKLEEDGRAAVQGGRWAPAGP